MAIIENRVKRNSSILKWLFLKHKTFSHFGVMFLLLFSLFLFFSHERNKNTSLQLSIAGSVLNFVRPLYDSVFYALKYWNDYILYIPKIYQENKILNQKLLTLYYNQSTYQSLHSEHEELKKLLAIIDNKNYNFKTARLVGILSDPFNSTAIIAAGKMQGIKVEQVITDGRWLIGHVSEVSDNYSKVLLIDDKRVRIPVISKISGERGILTSNDGYFKMLYLKDNHSIEVDEVIETSGDGNIYPLGIGVAKVEGVDKNLLLTFSSLTDIKQVKFVNILELQK